MRSFDYGTEAVLGVSLLLARYPLNERLLIQALGRVGRGFGTTCKRFKLPGLDFELGELTRLRTSLMNKPAI